jgi:hypothetical protein
MIRMLLLALITASVIYGTQLQAAEDETNLDLGGPELAGGDENASNPLAAVSNTDLRWQYLDSFVDGSSHLNDYFIDGAFMLNSK